MPHNISGIAHPSLGMERASGTPGGERVSYAGRTWSWLRVDHLLSRLAYAILALLGLHKAKSTTKPFERRGIASPLSPEEKKEIAELVEKIAEYRSGEISEEEGKEAIRRLRELDPVAKRQHFLHKKMGAAGTERARAWRALYDARERKNLHFVKVGPGNNINATYTNETRDFVAKSPSRKAMLEEELHMDALFALFGNQKIVPSHHSKNLKCKTRGGEEASISMLIKPYEKFVTYKEFEDLLHDLSRVELLLATLDQESQEAILLSLLFQFADLHGANLGFRPKKSAKLEPLYRATNVRYDHKSLDLPSLWTKVVTKSLREDLPLHITWEDGTWSKGTVKEIRIPGNPGQSLEEALRSVEGEIVLFDTDVSFMESDHYAKTISGLFNPSYLPAIRNRLLETEFVKKPLSREFLQNFLEKMDTSTEEIYRYAFKWHLPIRQRLRTEDNLELDDIMRKLTEEYRLHGPAPAHKGSAIHSEFTVKVLAQTFAEEFETSPEKFDKLWKFLKEKEIPFERRKQALLESLFPHFTIAQCEALRGRRERLKKAISEHEGEHPPSLLDLAEAMYPHLHQAINLAKWGHWRVGLHIF